MTLERLDSIGGRTIVLYLLTTVFAVCIGLLFANLLNVGAGYTLSTEELTYEVAESPSFIETLVNIFPSNFLDPMVQATMLQVIVVALFFGFGIMFVGEKAAIVKDFCIAMSEVCMKVMQGILYMAPIGVFGLLVPVVAQNGPDILGPLMWLIAVMAIVCVVQVGIVYTGLIKFLARRSPPCVSKRRASGNELRFRLCVFHGHIAHKHGMRQRKWACRKRLLPSCCHLEQQSIWMAPLSIRVYVRYLSPRYSGSTLLWEHR